METKIFMIDGKEVELEVGAPEEDNIDYDLPRDIEQDLIDTNELENLVEEVQNA